MTRRKVIRPSYYNTVGFKSRNDLDDIPIDMPKDEASEETYADPFYAKSSALLSDNLKEEEVESSFLSESSK